MVHRQRGMTMQPKDPTGPSTATGEPAKAPGLWKHIQAWDGKLSLAKGLTAVTLLTGFLGGYFQYLGAYEDKVREQAKTDMAAATAPRGAAAAGAAARSRSACSRSPAPRRRW